MTPRRAGAYELLELVGRGAAGAVHRARAPDGRTVAVKLLLEKSARAVALHDRERRLLATAGEGFVPLLDAGATEAGPFLVMPFLEGGTLRDRLHRGPLSVAETRRLGATLAAALGRAHARGIVHRDVKPSNILFTGEGEPLIADLGLAKHFAPDAPGASQSVAITKDGVLKGSFGYMPPEQMRDAKSVGPAADVFALGVVLYECLAGEPPFADDTHRTRLEAVIRGRFEPLAKRRPDVPAPLAAAIERALAGEPAARFVDGADFAHALAGSEKGPPANRRLLLGALGAAAALVLIALALRQRGHGSEGVAAPVAPLASDAAAVDAAALLERAGSAAPALTPQDEEALAARLGAGADAARIALVASALDGVTAELHAATREVYREAAAPSPDEASAGEAPLDGLEAALAALEALEPGADLDEGSGYLLARAARRLEARAARAAPPGAPPPRARELIAAHQAERLSGPRRSLARVSTLALGRASGPRAFAALARHLAAELDERRAIPVALAVVHAGGQATSSGVERVLGAARRRFGVASAFWTEVGPLLRGPESARDESASDLAAAAGAALERRDFVGARALADRAVALDPGLAVAWLRRGVARSEQRELAAAQLDLSRAIELDPRLAAALAARASLRRDQDDAKGALSDAERALVLDPRLATAWAESAAAKKDLGDPRGAIEDATRAIGLDPRSAKAYQTRGVARAALGEAEREAAIQDLEASLRLAPERASADKVRRLLEQLREKR